MASDRATGRVVGLLLITALGWACEPECFDVNDCLAAVPQGQRAACESGGCVYRAAPQESIDPSVYGGEGAAAVDPPLDAGETPDSGNAPDAGVPAAGAPRDAGPPDAGPPDAGPPDAGGPTSFVVVLYPAAQLAPQVDGGGVRGAGTASVSWNGQWQLTFSLGHDAGSAVLAAELHSAIAPRVGPLVASLSATGQSPVTGTTVITPLMLKELQGGRAYLAFPSASEPEGLLRGQLVLPGEVLAAEQLLPLPGWAHPGSGGSQLLIRTATLTARYEAAWTSEVVATAAHIHGPDGGVLVSLQLLPDAGGARGTLSLTSLQLCQVQRCLTDVHTADGGVAGAPAGSGNVLLRSP